MPELPEVETIKRELRSLILNKKIKEFHVHDKILLKKPKAQAGWNKIISSKVKDVERKGKFIVIKLSNGLKIVIHLKMTGQLIYGGTNNAKIKLVFSDSSYMSYYDKRRFGEWYLIKKEKEVPLLSLMGLDPTVESFTLAALKILLKKQNTKVYSFLMEQKLIAGIGNIYANEILYRAKISPFRKTKDIDEPAAEILYYAIKEIINKALKARGSSIDTYLDIWGNPGKYGYEHIVYGKEGQFCPHCPNKIMRSNLSGRSIYFCPGCQY